MKNIWKILLASATAVSLFAACAPEEKLDLAGYPETTALGFNISDIKTPASLVELTATYDNKGTIVLDGEVTHTYTLRLDSPSSQDMTVTVEPIIVNIPENLVAIDATTFTLPAGEIELPIVLALTDALKFATDYKDEQTYELGLRVVDVQGYNLSADVIGSEAKVVINKERYQAALSLVDMLGKSSVGFNRIYKDGALDTNEPLTQIFKAALSRPASEDITLTFDMEGMPAEFADDMTISPVTVVIAAGDVESEEITWTATPDFLLANSDPGKYTLTLQAAIESDDPYVVPDEDNGNGALSINVMKGAELIEVVSPLPGTWTLLPTTDWLCSEPGMIDGSLYGYFEIPLTITIDMTQVMDLQGFGVAPYYGIASYNANEMQVSVSDDGENYLYIGTALTSTKTNPFLAGLKVPISARYLKITFKTSNYGYVSEAYVYGAAQ